MISWRQTFASIYGLTFVGIISLIMIVSLLYSMQHTTSIPMYHTPLCNHSECGVGVKHSRQSMHAPLCNRLKPSLSECSQSIFEEMRFEGTACPAQCVTFVAYGGFNNMIMQVNNAMGEFLNTGINNAPNSKSIVLHHSFKNIFEIHLDFGKLFKSCIFTSWSNRWHQAYQGKCMELRRSQVFDATNFAMSRNRYEQGLGITWLLLGAMSDEFRNNISPVLNELGTNYSTLHARFLDGECVHRHISKGLSADICNLRPDFIATTFRALGHTSEKIIICTDYQQPALTAKISLSMQAVLSHNTNAISDMMLLIYSKRFVGNDVSTFSKNVMMVRHTIFRDTIDVLK